MLISNTTKACKTEEKNSQQAINEEDDMILKNYNNFIVLSSKWTSISTVWQKLYYFRINEGFG